MRAPVLGGNFGVWGGLFSSFDCAVKGVRKKEDPYVPSKSISQPLQSVFQLWTARSGNLFPSRGGKNMQLTIKADTMLSQVSRRQLHADKILTRDRLPASSQAAR